MHNILNFVQEKNINKKNLNHEILFVVLFIKDNFLKGEF